MTSSASSESVKQAAKEAVTGQVDIRSRVRDITLKAFTERKLDQESIKQVVHAVTDGVMEGLEGSRDKIDASMKEAVSGLDDALSKSAEAAKLATEEALGRAGEFTDREFKHALDQLKDLESSFIDTLTTVANESSRLVNESLKDLVSHLQRTGTDAGATAKEAVVTLQEQLAKTGKEGMGNAMETGRQVGSQIAQLDSGILAGLADALDQRCGHAAWVRTLQPLGLQGQGAQAQGSLHLHGGRACIPGDDLTGLQGVAEIIQNRCQLAGPG